jgi:hypothetical protein
MIALINRGQRRVGSVALIIQMTCRPALKPSRPGKLALRPGKAEIASIKLVAPLLLTNSWLCEVTSPAYAGHGNDCIKQVKGKS